MLCKYNNMKYFTYDYFVYNRVYKSYGPVINSSK